MKKIFKQVVTDASLVGATAMVFSKGKIVEKLTYGYYDRENKKKMTTDTNVRIASVSKIMVALCLMRLHEEGKVDLDLDISEYLGFEVRNPKFPDKIITLRMILAHTSSITDGIELEDGSGVNGYNGINGTNEECSLKDLLHPEGKYYVKETYSDNEPGVYYEYSNFGCGIIACVVEIITGEYFTDYVRKLIFDPLEIDASFIVTEVKTKRIASTYGHKDGENFLKRTKESFAKNIYKKFPIGQNFRGPAGGCFISAEGLMKLLITLVNGGSPIINKDTLAKMLQINYLGKKREWLADTARGLHLSILSHFDNHRLFGHFGDAYGVKSNLLFNPKEQFGIVFITNGGGFKYQKCGIADVQEKLIQAAIDKYWNVEYPSIFKFNVADDYGYLLDRKIILDKKVTDEGVYFHRKSIFDALGINTLKDYEYFENEEYFLLDKVLEDFKEKYQFQILKSEDAYLISYNL